MKLSTRGEYGVRAMLDLALYYSSGPVTLKSIAEREDISEHYLEQLFGALRKSGLVNSVRGAQGGYELSRSPSLIKVGDIIRVLEGPIAPLDCVEEGSDPSCCHRAGNCVTRTLWKRLRDSMIAILDSTTLADLCDQANALRASEGIQMYQI